MARLVDAEWCLLLFLPKIHKLVALISLTVQITNHIYLAASECILVYFQGWLNKYDLWFILIPVYSWLWHRYLRLPFLSLFLEQLLGSPSFASATLGRWYNLQIQYPAFTLMEPIILLLSHSERSKHFEMALSGIWDPIGSDAFFDLIVIGISS